MHESAQDITTLNMLMCYGLLLLAIVLSRVHKITLTRELVLATLRMTLQLILVGYILKALFAIDYWYFSLGVALVMVFFGAQTIYARVGIKQRNLLLYSFVSLLCSSATIMSFFSILVVQYSPWYNPRYFIPLIGMIIGNSMNGTALAIERFYDELKKRQVEIETYLTLGATSNEASAGCLRAAYRASILPTISSMTGMGLVFLPGMMTGQIIGGSGPLVAIKYQIAIILAILGAVSISCFLALRLERNNLFDRYHLPVESIRFKA
ncbi:iron export ABC transporter permease subunit FetB [bacterium]|nr:iron export ABC transporter permease subunit FetB [bacterium]